MFVFHFIAIFGRPLELTLAYETKKDKNRKVPELVQMCVEFLQANGLEMEGIFRLVPLYSVFIYTLSGHAEQL